MTARYGGRQTLLAPRERLTASPEETASRAPLRQALDQMQPGWDDVKGPWLTGYHSPIPLPLAAHLAFGEVDFTGLRVDRLTVIGRVDEIHPHEKRSARRLGARWLVRCACGIYETRRGGGLKGRMRADRAMCQACDYVLHIRRRAFFDRTGVWPPDSHGRESLPTLDLRAAAQSMPVNRVSPPDPNDKGHKAKGDRTAQRARRRARERAQNRQR